MPTLNDANGTPQRVNDNGFALNVCATMDFPAHAADHGDSYTIVYSGDPGGTDADFLYMKNLSDMLLRIYKIKIYCTADVEVTIKTNVTGTPTNTTTVTPVNSCIGNGNLAEGDFYSRAGDLALTGGDTYDSLIYDASCNNEIKWHYLAEITLQKNKAIVFNNVTDPNAAIRMSVYFYYHSAIA